jgi:hypothetical protein
MTVMSDRVQIFRGAGKIIAAKIEQMQRQALGLSIVSVDEMKDVEALPWQSFRLLEDQARRSLVSLGTMAGFGLAVVSFALWISAIAIEIAKGVDAESVRVENQIKLDQLMAAAKNASINPMRADVSEFLRINRELLLIRGVMTRYELVNGVARWSAMVPVGITGDRLQTMGARLVGFRDDMALIEGGPGK